jgi:phosphopantetheinyl transferase
VVGLDIEVLDRDRDLLALSEQEFSVEETERLRALEGMTRVRAFYELWSRKEAAYKLVAASLAQARQHFSVLAHAEISIVLCSDMPLSNLILRKVDAL